MLRKILDGIWFISMFTGFLLLLGVCGYIEFNDLDVLKITMLTGSGIALMILGYLGFKLGGNEYVD